LSSNTLIGLEKSTVGGMAGGAVAVFSAARQGALVLAAARQNGRALSACLMQPTGQAQCPPGSRQTSPW